MEEKVYQPSLFDNRLFEYLIHTLPHQVLEILCSDPCMNNSVVYNLLLQVFHSNRQAKEHLVCRSLDNNK